LAGVLAVAVAVFVFINQRSDSSKRLSVELITRSILVDEEVSDAERPLELIYGGRPVENFAILQCRISNTGGQPIRSADYESPVRLNVVNAAR